MDKNELRSALGKIVEEKISHRVDLWPRVKIEIAHLNPPALRREYKLSASLLLAVMALVVASTAVFALYRLLGSDAGLEGVNEQNLITTVEAAAVPTIYSTPPQVTPISKWSEETSAPPATIIAEQAMQNVKVTVNWAYADESRVAVRFTIAGLNLPEGLDYGYGAMGTFSLKDANGNILGQDGFSTAAENREDGSKVITANYYGKIDADKTPTLNLTLNVRVGGFDAPYLPPGSESGNPEMRSIPLMGSTKFHFSVPVYKGIEVVVDQSAEANGVTMRLEKLTINRSHTEAVVCFDMPSAKDWQLWKATLRIGESEEYSYSLAANAISGNFKGSNDLNAPERCGMVGFDAPYDGLAKTFILYVPYLITSVPEHITQERVETANEKLKPYGIVFAYLGRDVQILQQPDGMEEWEVYQLVWDSLADQYPGPWSFKVSIKP